MACMRVTMLVAGVLAATSFAGNPGFAGNTGLAVDNPDIAFAKRMFAGSAPQPKGYACFVRRYDAAHMAQHPKQKVTVLKLLITAEMVPDDKVLEYSFRLGVNFRDRPGDFDSSGDCGHAAVTKVPDPAETVIPAGTDIVCAVDCDGGGVTVSLANNDASVIVRPLDRIRIWKGKDFDESAATALNAGADDKVFRLDRTKLDECTPLVADRKELAAMRHK
ncbi:MAG TPA: hypothetical protein VK337_23420 [Xanthobacteraceae bacterium]|nr:hypothetical protein [Xanthobacteraceae bacterium]